jgi:protein PhnA
MTLPSCPKCSSDYVYQDGNLLVCPECAYEFSAEDLKEHEVVIKDANSNVLKDGDTVTVIKDLKIHAKWHNSHTLLNGCRLTKS